MEEQKAILKCFRILSEEQNEDLMQRDTELSFDLKKNGDMSFEDALEDCRGSLSYVILPQAGEKSPSNSVGHITRREAGNESDMTDKEWNNVSLTEEQSVAVNSSEKQTFATNQKQNKMPGEHCDKVNGRCNEGCHISLDECALEESLQAKCQHISTDCTNADCDCAAAVGVNEDETKEANQRVRKEHENVHCREDFVTSASNSDAGFDPEESAESRPSKTKQVVITVTRTGPAVEEKAEPIIAPALEQTGDPSSFKNEEERTGAEEDSEEEEEKRDVFPDFSSQPTHPTSPKDTSPNIFISSAPSNPPPGSTLTRATFSPGSPTDKQIQLPALFSGLRVLKKGVVGPEHDTVAQIKPSSQGARRDTIPGDAKVQGSLLDQISHFLSREKGGDEKEEKGTEAEADQDDTREKKESEESPEGERKEPETEADAEVSPESTKPSVSSAEAAFDAFKAFFTPKPLKRDPAEKVDLEAVRKKIRADKDVLRALFDRTSNKTPEKKNSPDCKVRNVY